MLALQLRARLPTIKMTQSLLNIPVSPTSTLFDTRAFIFSSQRSLSSSTTKPKGNWAKWKDYKSSIVEKYPKTMRFFRFSTTGWKLFRVFILCLGTYQSGKMVGIAEYASDPRSMEKKLTQQLLMSCAWEKGKDDKPKMPRILRRSETTHKRVEHVGERIVQGARFFCEAKCNSRRKKLQADDNLPPMSPRKLEAEDRQKIIGELLHWEKKLRMCKGNWTYIVINSPYPNAFVSDLAPRKIFVHDSLVERLRATDDELGMVLGHEISHLLHGHTEQRHEKAMWYSMYQLIFLTALDSWGILTFISLPFADRMQKMWLAAHSRENECEADETGLKIAALSCFNTHAGPRVFNKLAKLDGRDSKDTQAQWSDTHPLPMDRMKTLTQQSKHINCDRVKHCHSFLERFLEAKRNGTHYNEITSHLTKDNEDDA